MSSLPQEDPYLALGLTKDADLAAIKSAHRKLVLKCHPDKIHDVALKAIKQDEFQKVQQAYELLSDDTRRSKYDEQIKLYELRKEMGRGDAPPGRSPFDYEIRTAEPRQSSFRASPKDSSRGYGSTSPRVYEEEVRASSFEEPLRARARKTASYEERRRPSTREGEWQRRSEEEREKEQWEKEIRRSAQSAARKTRDKERKKGSEEKFSRSTAAYVEDDDSEDGYRPRPENKPSRGFDDEIRVRGGVGRATERLRKDEVLTDRTKKLNAHKDFAAQYMQAAHRKASPESEFRPKPMRRAETFHEPAYKVRYATPPSPYAEEEDSPRRSSARSTPRRPDQIPIRNRSPPRSSGKERKTSPYERDPYIVEASPPSPPSPPPRKPLLHSHTSAPPIIPISSSSRKEPSRSKTMQAEYMRRESTTAPPPLPRASTFQAGDKSKSSSKGSKLKTQMHYASDDSGPDDYPLRPVTPPRRREQPETTRYVIDKGRSVPLSRHRTAVREDNYDGLRDRSESPHGGRRGADRPPIVRSGTSSHASSSRGPYYSTSHSAEPIIKEVRPKVSSRDSAGNSPSSRNNTYFGEVNYAPQYSPQDATYAPGGFRRGSDPTNHRDFAYAPRAGREAAYA